MKYLILFLHLLVLCSYSSIAQQQINLVKGRVVDQMNKPIPDVTITSKQTKVKSHTDRNGDFEIKIQGADTLMVGRVGFDMRIVPVKLQDVPLLIALEQSTYRIDEVTINTGYQQLKPNEVNGSVTVIDNKMLNMQSGTNILQRLNGVTNGLTFQVGKRNTNPQNKTNINIRGYSTINGPLDPLIVLDNFVYEGDIDNINPDEVENVTILKDASATSIYGARGGNGVIVITTKKGSFGQPTQLNFSTAYTIDDIPDLSPLKSMSNRDYIDVERMLYERGFFKSQINSTSRPALSPVVDILNRQEKGLLSKEEADYQISRYENVDFLKQYTDVFYKRNLMQQYNMNLSGGTEKHTWNISTSLNKGDAVENKNNRKNIRLGNQVKLSEWMQLGVAGAINDQRNKIGNIPSVSDLRRFGNRSVVPYVMLVDENGQPREVTNKFNTLYLDTVGKGRLEPWDYFPTLDQGGRRQTDRSQELIGEINLLLTPFRGVRFIGGYQYQRQIVNSELFYDRDGYFMRDMINRYAKINETSGNLTYPVPNADMILYNTARIETNQFRTQVDYRKSWRTHATNVMLGFESREVKTDGDNYRVYGYNYDPLSVVPVDYLTRFPVRPSGQIVIPGAPSLRPTVTNRFVSVFGNGFYSYKDRYSLSASFRKDGSNIYGVTTNDKWKPLWSLGAGYEISKESFFKSSVFEYLKLRTTFGYSGNVDLSRSALPVAGFMNGEEALGSLPVARIGTLNNPSLRWEQVRQVNFGVDFKAWTARIAGSLEYYKKESTDLYGPSLYDYTTWGVAPTIVMNAADLSGDGVDLQLRIVPLQKNVIWNSTLIFNYNNSIVKRYYLSDQSERSDIDRIIDQKGDLITPVEGLPLYALAAYRWGGLDSQGNPQGYLNGELSKDYTAIRNDVRENNGDTGNARYIGTASPRYFGSWLNEFAYRNFSISFNITYRAGYYFRRQSIMYDGLISGGAGHSDFGLRWQQPGDEAITDIPSFIYPTTVTNRDFFYGLSDVLIEKGDHIRLQFVNLGYTLYKANKYMPKQTRFFVNVNDLGIIWRANKKGLDPEYPYTARPVRTMTIGFSTRF